MEVKRDYPTKKEAVLILVITFAILFFISGILSGTVFSGRKEGFLAEIFVIIPAIWFSYKRGFSIKKVFRLNKVNINIIVYSLLIGLSFLILSEEFERIIKAIFPLPEGISEIEEEMTKLFKTNNPYEFVILITAGVLMAGIFEEMLFRGFLLYSFEKQMEVTRAVIITAIIFAFIHYIWVIWPWYMVQIVILGVILGVLSWKSNSIFPPASVHILYNAVSILYTNNENISTPSWAEWKGHISPILILLAGFLIIYGFKRFYVSCDEYKNNQETYLVE